MFFNVEFEIVVAETGDVMKERIEVYETIRNELIVIEELQRNVWIYMYVLFCTLFVLGLEWSHFLFLVSYIVLIPFQCVINDYQWSISKMSIYIRVFFENDNRDISWESLHVCDIYKEYYKQKKKSIRNIIKISSVSHLGFLATGFYCVYTLKDSYINNNFVLDLENIFLIILSIILFIILIFINKDFYKNYDKELENIMTQYKEEREKMQCKDVEDKK